MTDKAKRLSLAATVWQYAENGHDLRGICGETMLTPQQVWQLLELHGRWRAARAVKRGRECIRCHAPL